MPNKCLGASLGKIIRTQTGPACVVAIPSVRFFSPSGTYSAPVPQFSDPTSLSKRAACLSRHFFFFLGLRGA